MTKFKHNLTTFLLALFLSLGAGMATADDTEIYFSPVTTSTIRPNVLLMLDTSGSMGSTANDDPQNRSRLQVMKDALNNMLDSVTGIDIGLMRFSSINSNTGNKGGAVIYPVTYVDAYNRDTVSEPNDGVSTGTTTLTYALTDGDHDAVQELGSNSVDLAGVTLELGETEVAAGAGLFDIRVAHYLDDEVDRTNSGSFQTFPSSTVLRMDKDRNPIKDYIVGLRFQGVPIPKNATIATANLDMTTSTFLAPGDSTAKFTVYGENVDNTVQFGQGGGDLPTRPTTAASVDWSGFSLTNGTTNTLTTIAPLVQEIVNRAGWESGNAMGLILKDGKFGLRDFYSYESTGTTTYHPRLHGTFTTPAIGPYHNKVALRFPQINIPRGSTVTSAKIEFTAAATDAGNAKWTIAAEDTGQPAVYAATNNNIGARTALTTNTVNVNLASQVWTAGNTYETPDLSAVVNEVIGNADWCGGGQNNALSFIIDTTGSNEQRLARSVESGSGAPRLHLTYTPNIGGCIVETLTQQPKEQSDDSEERYSDGVIDFLTSTDLDIGSSKMLGVRFNNISIPKDAVIESAVLELTCFDDCSNSLGDVTIKGFLTSDVNAFTSTTDNISDRATTTASATFTPGSWSSGQVISSPELKTIVQEIVNQAGWSSGNALGVLVTGASGNRELYSFENDPSRAPRLRVTFEGDGTGGLLVRQRLKQMVNAISAGGYTPIVETLYEAARYWRSETVKFGKTRNGMRTNRVSHPASYCDGDSSCGGANTATYPPYGVQRAAGCTDANLDDSDCSSEVIHGTPNYISPFSTALSCESSYQVLLTDGEANALSSTSISEIRTNYLGGATCVTTRPDGTSVQSAETCGIDLAEYLHTQDQDSTLDNDQTVTTYTIGLDFCPSGQTAARKETGGDVTCCATASIIAAAEGLGTCPDAATTSNASNALRFLDAVADKGDGFFSEAKNTDDLTTIFENIITDVAQRPTTFAAPAITTNFFNRTRSRDEIYFGLFTPDEGRRWDGNVKRFRVCVDDDTAVNGTVCTTQQVLDTTILDANGNEATDPVTLLFKDTSKSFWSSAADGNETVAGGAGAEITDYTTRIIYTDEDSSGLAASGTSLDTDNFKLTSSNWDSDGTPAPDLTRIHNAVCTTPGTLTAGSECENKMLWLLGKDVLDEDDDSDTTDTRWGFGDVIHSSPVVITYGFIDSILNVDTDSDGVADATNGKVDGGEALVDKLLVSTNDGGLRMINTTNGWEDWRFMPQSTLVNTGDLYNNAVGDHIYGMDDTPVLHITDNNNNGVIEPGGTELDTVHIYQTMRRGGNYLYALDVTPASTLTSEAATPAASAAQIVPKLRWRIDGSMADYNRMGDTWSKPVMAKINLVSGGLVAKDVLIMGGGYDDRLDNDQFGISSTTPDANMGNAIYIIDPADGTKLLSISHADDSGVGGTGVVGGSGADIEIKGFNHSITSRIAVIDSDDDGIHDRLYASDTAGNVWRVDLGDDIRANGFGLTNGSFDTTVGHLAKLSTPGTAVDQRRFYGDMATVRVIDNIYTDTTSWTSNSGPDAGKMTYLLLTSGYRAHPLDTAVSDRYYALRDKEVGRMNDSDSDRKADGLSGSAFGSPITESDLADTTTAALTVAGGTNDALNKRGYYLDFPDTGEKGLSNVVVLFGQVFFTTFVPSSAPANACEANIGQSFGYALNLASGDGVIDWDVDGDTDIADRRHSLGAGLSSDPLPVFTDAGVKIITGLQQSVQSLSDTNTNSIVRTYWYESQN